MNKFNKQPVDTKALPTRYAAKMDQIRAFVANEDQLRLATSPPHAQHYIYEPDAARRVVSLSTSSFFVFLGSDTRLNLDHGMN
jgi:hypothetical protein